jgi:hypothetical protein
MNLNRPLSLYKLSVSISMVQFHSIKNGAESFGKTESPHFISHEAFTGNLGRGERLCSFDFRKTRGPKHVEYVLGLPKLFSRQFSSHCFTSTMDHPSHQNQARYSKFNKFAS